MHHRKWITFGLPGQSDLDSLGENRYLFRESREIDDTLLRKYAISNF